jgi:DNA-binding MurR/RpiR family transcriptional regulator
MRALAVADTTAGASDAPLAERVAARLTDLSPTERRVASFLVEHAEEAAFISAAEMAGQLGTSDATVVRTVQSLGYAGLPELKRELVNALKSRATPALRLGRSLAQIGDGPENALEYALAMQLELLEEARRTVRPEAFLRAVGIIRAAKRTHVFGIGPTGALCRYLAMRLVRFGYQASFVTDTGLLLADGLLSIRPGDALVVLAYGQVLREVDVILDRAKDMRAPVVLLTDTLAAALGDRIDVALSASRGAADMWSTIATTAVLMDAVLFGIAIADRGRSLANLEELNRLRAEIVGNGPDTPRAAVRGSRRNSR